MEKKIILAVDDVTINLMSIKNALSMYDSVIDIRIAKNSDMAFYILKKTKVDLILLDIEMPDMSGFEMLDIIKAIPEIKDIPVIFVTSSADVKSVYRASQGGALDYIAKPINPVVLKTKVFSALDIPVPNL